jgi:hypothetical protein
MKTKFYICGGGCTTWEPTNAKTLAGAKIAAGRKYQLAASGLIFVGQYNGDSIIKVAVRHGFDAWGEA